MKAAKLPDPLPLRLRPLQEWLASAIMHPGSIAASLGESEIISASSLTMNELDRIVSPSVTLSAESRVQIYRQAYRSRLVECLADDYPAVQHALGDDDFADVCRSYIDRYPSRSPSLNAYGRHFSRFVASSAHPRAPFAADLAALEWALVEVVHAPSSERLSLDQLSAVSIDRWAGARFRGGESVRVLELGHPANAYFQAFLQDQNPDISPPAWSATAVFRDGPTLLRMDLTRPMHLMLRSLFSGRSLAQAIDDLVVDESACASEESDLMRWFQDWVRHGFFAQIIAAPE